MGARPDEETLVVDEEQGIVRVRQSVRDMARSQGFGLVDQTKLVTAASELARNCLIHGGGGTCRIEVVQGGDRTGLKLTVSDSGPGIADVSEALRDGFTTISGLGLGLGGARRLVHEFNIDSRPGEGTTVTAVRWR